jgi:hypothetical protein
LSNFLVSVAASARVLVLLLLATAVGDLLLRWRRYSILEKYILFMGLAFFLSMCLLNEKRINYLYPAFPFFLAFIAIFLGKMLNAHNHCLLGAIAAIAICGGLLVPIEPGAVTTVLGICSVVVLGGSVVFQESRREVTIRNLRTAAVALLLLTLVVPIGNQVREAKPRLMDSTFHKYADVIKRIIPASINPNSWPISAVRWT